MDRILQISDLQLVVAKEMAKFNLTWVVIISKIDSYDSLTNYQHNNKNKINSEDIINLM
jgi:hypothetical protein